MTNLSRLRSRRTHLLIALVALLVASLLGLAACSGADGSDEGSDAASSDLDMPMPMEEPAGMADGAGGGDSAVMSEAEGQAADTMTSGQPAARRSIQQREIIATGVVSLHSEDVGQALFDIQKVVDTYRGEVTEEESKSSDDGEVRRSRLVIRVPVASFDDTVADLKKVGHLVSASTGAQDVTTEVIDTEVRIRAQEKSLERIEVLLAQAQSIRDIVAIEAQLTRRQAELDSLKGQMAWLQDQTSMSTITVHLEKTPKKKAAAAEDRGFLAGLSAGWAGLQSFVTGAATIVGAILPFAILALIIALPTWLILRRSLRSRRPPGSVTP